MNDLQLHIYQLLQEMDSSENDTPEGVDKAHLAEPAKEQLEIEEDTPERLDKGQLPEAAKEANVEKSKGKCKEKFLCLCSNKTITLGKRSTSTEIEEKPEVEQLLHIVERESIKDKE